MIRVITSESVNIGHPDKTCDVISDAFLDEALKQDPNSMMAVECAIKNDKLFIYGEATTKAQINYEKIAKEILKDIGYKNEFTIVKEISEYDLDLIASLVSGTAKFSTPPNYEINFGLKDEDCAKEEILALAYKNAENQAKAIAIASGKQIDECVSVSFDSFQEKVFSNTNFGVTRDMVKLSSTIEDIKVTFVPADVVIEKTIHCIFTTKP